MNQDTESDRKQDGRTQGAVVASDSMDEALTFGGWLKRRRRSLDLTQESLAEAIGYTVDTIRKIEAGVRRPSRQVAEMLASALGVPPAERDAFMAWARADRSPSSHEAGVAPANYTAPPGVPGPLPEPTLPPSLPVPATTFVGRAAQVEAICAMLRGEAVRLLTLTGPGGVGKTRLALTAAREVQARFPDGVWFVPLAAIRDPELVPARVAQVLDLRAPTPAAILAHLGHYLHDKRALFVLDNFEQVLDAAESVASLVNAAPHLKVLVTSRRPLRVSGEQEFPVSPLALPGAVQVNGVASLLDTPAVQLFVDRARAIRPDLMIGSAAAPVVASICARLDGLPLAIELAATQVRVLSLPALLGRLERGLPIPPAGERDRSARQQTMQATVAWSYDLLTVPARTLFARLAVFDGGWTPESMAAVCAAGSGQERDSLPATGTSGLGTETELLAALSELIESSLVQLHDNPAGEARYSMLETIRAYAEERLSASPEEAELREAHARHFLALMQAAETQLLGRDQSDWLARLDDEQPNLRAALRWALAHGEVQAAAEAASAVWRFWNARGFMGEGRRWLDEILCNGAAISTPVRARVLNALGILARGQLDYAAAETYLAESLELNRSLNNSVGIEGALNNLGLVAFSRGDYRLAQARFLECLALSRQMGDSEIMSFPLSNLGLLSWARGDYRQARSYLNEALQIKRASRDMHGVAINLNNLGAVLARLGSYGEADAAAAEGLDLLKGLRSQWGMSIWMLRRASALAAAGEWERAAQVWGAARTQLTRIGTDMEEADQAEYAHARAIAAAQGSESMWMLAEAVGQHQPLDAALELALRPITAPFIGVPSSQKAGRVQATADALTEREGEVLRLVSAGLTNAEIAAQLVLSRRTVQAHLYSIYRKLGVSSRHGAAHYARQHGLT